MAKRIGLGKGLEALFVDNNTEDTAVSNLKISHIEPNKSQPRTDFDDEALRELADSIRVHGVIQPLVVRPINGGNYQIVAGERRWRAARMAGLNELPVVIRDFDDSQALEIAIIENLQRENLNVVELAYGYKLLIEKYDMTQEQVAEKLGKSRPVIANTIRMLALPESVQEDIRAGKISTGHAKALLALNDDELIIKVAQQIAERKVLVRDIEKLARTIKQNEKLSHKESLQEEVSWGDNYFREMELALKNELGRKVKITSKGQKSILVLEFYSKDELEELAARLTGNS